MNSKIIISKYITGKVRQMKDKGKDLNGTRARKDYFQKRTVKLAVYS